MPTAHAPAFTVAVALAAGMLAQAAAGHLNVPGIVILLFLGVLLGPEALGWVEPDSLGSALPTLVGFAVAVVLFEGGMNLDISRIRRQQRPIRMLITVGALITAAGATLTARWALGWDWTPSVLFGTLLVVTGPTVVTPLLRRIRIDSKVATVLEAEAVFGDAVGAVVAVVAYEFARNPIDAENLTHGLLQVVARLTVGAVAGGVAGALLVLLLRSEWAVPGGLENVFTLSMVLCVFQVSNAVLPESGVAAAIAAGLVVGNVRTRVSHQLQEFKEGLTVMMIGLLFVLLAADVDLSVIVGLGWPGLIAVVLVMFVVRPVAVFASTLGSGFPVRHRLLMSWLAPRGIIAASIASLFAVRLDAAELVGAAQLREMVFLVIFVTVCSSGLGGGFVSRILGLQRPKGSGWVILGANAMARAIARQLTAAGDEALCIDTNPDAARAAEQEEFRTVYGNGLKERTLLRVEASIRAGFVAATPNEAVNLLFAQQVRRHNRSAPLYVALNALNEGVTAEMVHTLGGRVLFGGAHRVARWDALFEKKEVVIEYWQAEGSARGFPPLSDPALDGQQPPPDSDLFLALVVRHRRRVLPLGDRQQLTRGDLVAVAMPSARVTEGRQRLAELGLVPAPLERFQQPLPRHRWSSWSRSPPTPQRQS